MRQKDMYETDPSTAGSSAVRVLEFDRMAQLAPVASVAADHVPPQNLDAEEWLLGAVLVSAGAMASVVEIARPSDFYRLGHGKIYKAAIDLYARGEPVDAVSVADHLDKSGELEAAGGRPRLHELANIVPATANAPHWARIVREMATLRGLVETGQRISLLGWQREGETADLVDQAERLVFDLSQQRATGEFAHVEELLKESFERITQLYESGAELTGTPSGFRDLDRLTSGFQPGNLIIGAARPSMGKSASSTFENRVQEVSQISRALKVLARDLEVPILALSQLSRAVEQRTDKKPILSDLRESGSLEQDADIVFFIYRDDYYNEESEQQGLAEVIVAKHRNGPTDAVKLSFPKRQ